MSTAREWIIPAGAGLTSEGQLEVLQSWDHPRGCGAHSFSKRESCWSMGSSPRVRGSLKKGDDDPLEVGIIPAGAGLTRLAAERERHSRNHPRGCGAHHPHHADRACEAGSSPRVRGSQQRILERFYRVGIIPAGAGLTPFSTPLFMDSRDHPRGCGAHPADSIDYQLKQGSSPRVRGSPARLFTTFSQLGIIPAGAGLTFSRAKLHSTTRDHPRGCGAHFAPCQKLRNSQGSSPRVRGSRAISAAAILCRRIIPAGAGLTVALLTICSADWDHPRGCEAHLFSEIQGAIAEGSSPRVRGSPWQKPLLSMPRGIIPAGAGLTVALLTICSADWDHPRGCGAHPGLLLVVQAAMGSSPRVRGSLHPCPPCNTESGIIPAGAGLTLLSAD